MKLLVKTGFYYILLSIVIVLLSAFVCYFIVDEEVTYSNNDLLLSHKNIVENYLRANDTAALSLMAQRNEGQVKKISRSEAKRKEKTFFSDTLVFDKNENEFISNRLITGVVTVGNENYEIKIWRDTFEFIELIEDWGYFLVVILILLFLISILINFWGSKKLWHSFYAAIENLKSFNANDNKIPQFEATNINEFSVLNESLKNMMSKMVVDFNSQKRFTENASHEIQTPLAVIKFKVDLLIQSENLKKEEIALIIDIDDACSQLIRLNKSLLLLTKIENRQFKTIQNVSVEKIIESSLLLFEEGVKASKINLIKHIDADFLININSDLCVVLVNNLIQNAIRHNNIGGSIIIVMKEDRLSIFNSAKQGKIQVDSLFGRFQKKSANRLSVGLGLSIAKEIAEVSDLNLEYDYCNDMHSFTLRRNEK